TVRAGLRDAYLDPVSEWRRVGGVAAADVAPDLHRGTQVHLHEVLQPIEVEIGQRRAAAPVEAQDPGRGGPFGERAVSVAQEVVAWIARGEALLLADVALRDEQVDEAVIV